MAENDEGMDQKFYGLTARQWDDRASDCFRRLAESIERSDTDGFMSQWAPGVMGTKYRAIASIARNGGSIEVPGLFDLSGNYVPARLVDTPYGLAWKLKDGGWFNGSKARDESIRVRNNARKGFFVGVVKAKAFLNKEDMEIYTRTDDVDAIVDVVKCSDEGKLPRE